MLYIKKLIIGAHVSMSAKDYLLGSLQDSIGYKANAMMIYTGAPQNKIRIPLEKLYIEEFKAGCKKNGIELENVVVHAPYLINLCSHSASTREFSIELLNRELQRTKAIGCKYIVLHPGSNNGHSHKDAIKLIAQGIDEAMKGIEGVFICLETMAGKGNEIGKIFEELHEIMTLCKSKLYVCFDTCHTNDAGYDLSNLPLLFEQMEKTFKLQNIKVIHLNDSKNDKGSHKDRHESIGYGKVGAKALLNIAHCKEFIDIVKILETPWTKEHDYYKTEIEIVRTNKWYDFKGND